MNFNFWGQILHGSERMELSEALKNLPSRLSPFLTAAIVELSTACPEKQGQQTANFPQNWNWQDPGLQK